MAENTANASISASWSDMQQQVGVLCNLCKGIKNVETCAFVQVIVATDVTQSSIMVAILLGGLERFFVSFGKLEQKYSGAHKY